MEFGFIGDNVGEFAVNPWTGHVWNLWTCKEITNLVVRKEQTEIKKRFTSEELKQYRRLAAFKPQCTN